MTTLEQTITVADDEQPTTAVLARPDRRAETNRRRHVETPAPPIRRPIRPSPPRRPRYRLIEIAPSQFAAGPRLRPAGNLSPGYQYCKRLFDIVGALALLVLFAPLLLATWLILLVTTKGKPIFVQQRVGWCGRPFRMYKFRTMHLNADQMQHLVRNEKDGPIFKNKRDPRITRIGRFLRSTSIDELPQLINVLLGHMALVGPRPPVPKEVAAYQPWQRGRLAVKPGLTCLWQVSGRCEIGFEDWVRMDLWYSRNQSLRTDLKLLLKTPMSVLSRRGAY